MAELGRITIYFGLLDSILKGLLVTLEKPQEHTMDVSAYARQQFSKTIKKCHKALKDLEPGFAGKHSKLFKDCAEQLDQCEKLRQLRNELIHAVWSTSAFPPDWATRIRTAKSKDSGNLETLIQGHDLESLRTVSLEIRNAHSPLHALTVKFRVIFQKQLRQTDRG